MALQSQLTTKSLEPLFQSPRLATSVLESDWWWRMKRELGNTYDYEVKGWSSGLLINSQSLASSFEKPLFIAGPNRTSGGLLQQVFLRLRRRNKIGRNKLHYSGNLPKFGPELNVNKCKLWGFRPVIRANSFISSHWGLEIVSLT